MKVSLLVLLFAGLCTACRDLPKANQVKDDPFVGAPAHTAFGLDILLTDSAFTKARINGKHGMLYDARQETALGGGVVVDFFVRGRANRAARLTSDSAVVDDRTKNMVAIGNVVVQSDSARTTIRTQRLSWIHSTQRIRSDNAVEIITPTERIDGEGFESDQFLTSYTIRTVRGVQKR